MKRKRKEIEKGRKGELTKKREKRKDNFNEATS